jgi:hypothetical protein
MVGSVVISLSVAVHVAFIAVAILSLSKIGEWLIRGSHLARLMLALIAVTLWVLAAHSVGVWIWALTFIVLGAFETLEPAVYFSVVSFTTLGFGDITLPVQWRILSGMSAANGLILFGLSTAFLIEFVSRLRHAQHQADGRGKKR